MILVVYFTFSPSLLSNNSTGVSQPKFLSSGLKIMLCHSIKHQKGTLHQNEHDKVYVEGSFRSEISKERSSKVYGSSCDFRIICMSNSISEGEEREEVI